jgi:hypothetical protein
MSGLWGTILPLLDLITVIKSDYGPLRLGRMSDNQSVEELSPGQHSNPRQMFDRAGWQGDCNFRPTYGATMWHSTRRVKNSRGESQSLMSLQPLHCLKIDDSISTLIRPTHLHDFTPASVTTCSHNIIKLRIRKLFRTRVGRCTPNALFCTPLDLDVHLLQIQFYRCKANHLTIPRYIQSEMILLISLFH